MDFQSMKRKELQALCKKHNIPANLTNLEMAKRLTSLLKEKEKPMTWGRSCLKNVGDLESENDSEGVNRQAKKVRFSPEDEMIEFVEVTKKGARRKSTIRDVEVEPTMKFEEKPTRATRSRSQTGGVTVDLPPIETKRTQRRLRSNDMEAKELTLVVDLSSSLTSDHVPEDAGVTTRSLRNRGVQNKKSKEVEKDVTIPRENQKKKSSNRDTKASDEISEDNQPEMAPRRSRRNTKKSEDYAMLNRGLANNGVSEMGRTAPTGTHAAYNVSAAECGIEVWGKVEVVLQVEEPSRGPSRDGDRKKSVMPQFEAVRSEGAVEEIENKKLSKFSVLAAGSSTKNIEKNDARPRKRCSQQENLEENDVRPRTRRSTKQESATNAGGNNRAADNIEKSKERKRRREDKVLEEESAMAESAFAREPPRRSSRNATKADVSGKVARRKNLRSRSEQPNVEEEPLVESRPDFKGQQILDVKHSVPGIAEIDPALNSSGVLNHRSSKNRKEFNENYQENEVFVECPEDLEEAEAKVPDSNFVKQDDQEENETLFFVSDSDGAEKGDDKVKPHDDNTNSSRDNEENYLSQVCQGSQNINTNNFVTFEPEENLNASGDVDLHEATSEDVSYLPHHKNNVTAEPPSIMDLKKENDKNGSTNDPALDSIEALNQNIIKYRKEVSEKSQEKEVFAECSKNPEDIDVEIPASNSAKSQDDQDKNGTPFSVSEPDVTENKDIAEGDDKVKPHDDDINRDYEDNSAYQVCQESQNINTDDFDKPEPEGNLNACSDMDLHHATSEDASDLSNHQSNGMAEPPGNLDPKENGSTIYPASDSIEDLNENTSKNRREFYKNSEEKEVSAECSEYPTEVDVEITTSNSSKSQDDQEENETSFSVSEPDIAEKNGIAKGEEKVKPHDNISKDYEENSASQFCQESQNINANDFDMLEPVENLNACSDVDLHHAKSEDASDLPHHQRDGTAEPTGNLGLSKECDNYENTIDPASNSRGVISHTTSKNRKEFSEKSQEKEVSAACSEYPEEVDVEMPASNSVKSLDDQDKNETPFSVSEPDVAKNMDIAKADDKVKPHDDNISRDFEDNSESQACQESQNINTNLKSRENKNGCSDVNIHHTTSEDASDLPHHQSDGMSEPTGNLGLRKEIDNNDNTIDPTSNNREVISHSTSKKREEFSEKSKEKEVSAECSVDFEEVDMQIPASNSVKSQDDQGENETLFSVSDLDVAENNDIVKGDNKVKPHDVDNSRNYVDNSASQVCQESQMTQIINTNDFDELEPEENLNASSDGHLHRATPGDSSDLPHHQTDSMAEPTGNLDLGKEIDKNEYTTKPASKSREVLSHCTNKNIREFTEKSQENEVSAECSEVLKEVEVEIPASYSLKSQDDQEENENPVSVSDPDVAENNDIAKGDDKVKLHDDNISREYEDNCASQVCQESHNFNTNDFDELEPEEIWNASSDGDPHQATCEDASDLPHHQTDVMDDPANNLNLRKEIEKNEKPATKKYDSSGIIGYNVVDDERASFHEEDCLASYLSNKEMSSSKVGLSWAIEMQDKGMEHGLSDFSNVPVSQLAIMNEAKDYGESIEKSLHLAEEETLPEIEFGDPSESMDLDDQVNGGSNQGLTKVPCKETDTEDKVMGELTSSSSECVLRNNLMEEDKTASVTSDKQTNTEGYEDLVDIFDKFGGAATEIDELNFNDVSRQKIKMVRELNKGTMGFGASELGLESDMFSGWEISLLLGDELMKSTSGMSEPCPTSTDGDSTSTTIGNSYADITVYAEENYVSTCKDGVETSKRIENADITVHAEENNVSGKYNNYKYIVNKPVETENYNFSMQKVMTEVSNINNSEYNALADPQGDKTSEEENMSNMFGEQAESLVEKQKVEMVEQASEPCEAVSESNSMVEYSSSEVTTTEGGAAAEGEEGDTMLNMINSTVRKMTSASSLIQGTPMKPMKTALEMKENAPSIKRENFGSMMLKSTKTRRALEDLQNN